MTASLAEWFSGVVIPGPAEIVGAVPVIVSLIIIEGLLSVDNALAIAAMAKHLPEAQQKVALRLGIFGAYLFRGICMALAAWIIANPWIKIGGSVYLVYLMCKHFTEDAEADAVHDAGRGGLVSTIIAIEIMDLSLSVDNVVAAVAMSPKLWVVCTGVFIGILALRFVAGACIKLIDRFPILGDVAFLLIGYVGCILAYELLSDPGSGLQILPGPVHVTSFEKFIGIAIILSFSIVYSKWPGLQRTLAPVFRALRFPMGWVAGSVGLALRVVLLPVTFLRRLARRS